MADGAVDSQNTVVEGADSLRTVVEVAQILGAAADTGTDRTVDFLLADNMAVAAAVDLATLFYVPVRLF